MLVVQNTIISLKTWLACLGLLIATGFFSSVIDSRATASAADNRGMSTQLKLSLFNNIAPITSVDALKGLPLIAIADLQYAGAFRIKSGTYGESRTGYSSGKMAYNPDAHSLFLTGHVNDSSLGEFFIPDLINSSVIAELNLSDRPRQDFVKLLNRVSNKNTQNINKLGGMEYINGELLVHTYEYYDAPADNTHTSLVIRNAANLASSPIDGFFSFNGAAHLILWISPLPANLQGLFQGDYLAGSSNAMPINSRSSMGPSAFVLNSADLIGTQKKEGLINTLRLLDFSLSHIMADNTQGWLPFSYGWGGNIQYNYSGARPGGDAFPKSYDPALVGNNLLWTEDSSAVYGLIIPGSRTYAVFGHSGMHKSGGGYKITQKSGRLCGGPCAYDPADNDNYYWFFDVQDLYQVKAGNKQPYEVKPYAYGEFNTPFDQVYDARRQVNSKPKIAGGTYNAKDGLIYFSLPGADHAQSYYEPPPIIMAYKVNVK